nr:hypothetical protein [Tanacetum cinerariifolium]
RTCLRHHLQSPTLLSTPILNREEYFREPTRSYQTETPPAPQDEDEHEPMFIQPPDPDFVPEPIYPDYIPLEDEYILPAEEQPLPHDDETEDGPVDYIIDGGDDGDDDDDGNSSRDDANDEDEDEEDEEEEEEHFASADSAVVIPTEELVSPPEGTKPVMPPPSKAEVERLLAMPTPSSSPLTSLSPPFAGERLARCMASATLPSPPLPPPLHVPPPVDRRDDIPETEMPPRKRLCFSTLGSRQIMAPVIRQGSSAFPNNTNPNNMTPEFVQAMIDQALLRNSANGDGSHTSHEDNRRNVQTALTRWIKKMESVFQISGCAVENQVKFATCTLLNVALTWWNSQLRSLGPDAYSMTWEVLKKKMTDKYCPQREIKKLEIELWNLKVKENNVSAYIERFQELTLICTKFIANETKKIDKYVNGLTDNIYESVKDSKPKTSDETIELANNLMDKKLHTYAERQSNNKRKADESFRNSHGHFARDCRSSGNANVANAQRNNGANPKGNGCFECGATGLFKRDCPKLKNKDGEKWNALGWVYAVGNAEKSGNASRHLDSNVVTGTFLLKTRYASILFDTGADRSFISTAFSSLIDISSLH